MVLLCILHLMSMTQLMLVLLQAISKLSGSSVECSLCWFTDTVITLISMDPMQLVYQLQAPSSTALSDMTDTPVTVMSDQPMRHAGRRRGRRTGALSSSLLTVSVLVSIQCQIYLMRAFFD